VDALDERFQQITAPISGLSDPDRWWRHRVPRDPTARDYLGRRRPGDAAP
jgi:hypothetical protein